MNDGVVWVTGGSRGIGRAVAHTMPWPETRVIEVSRSGGLDTGTHLQADLGSPSGWEELGSSFARELDGVWPGGRAVLVHNAGTLEPIGFAGEVDTEAYTGHVLLNAAAPQVIGHRFLQAVRGRDLDATLVMLTSGAASSVYEGWSAYGAAKAAVDHWVRIVGAEQRRRGGATVLAIAPGVVDTAMQDRIRATDPHDFPNHQRFVDLHEQGDLRDPDDVAAQLWRVVTSGGHPSGAVLDLRELE